MPLFNVSLGCRSFCRAWNVDARQGTPCRLHQPVSLQIPFSVGTCAEPNLESASLGGPEVHPGNLQGYAAGRAAAARQPPDAAHDLLFPSRDATHFSPFAYEVDDIDRDVREIACLDGSCRGDQVPGG